VKSADDSDLELNSDGEKVEKKKTGAFHKEYALSESLASLVGAERLSRPQVVKKLWVHIKAKELQDPNDKRNILCDEGMRKVFDKDTVHMFTMNKLLGKHLYPLPEGEGEEVKDEVKSETKVEDDSS
jgi:upstream activation factor subunit UAF30